MSRAKVSTPKRKRHPGHLVVLEEIKDLRGYLEFPPLTSAQDGYRQALRCLCRVLTRMEELPPQALSKVIAQLRKLQMTDQEAAGIIETTIQELTEDIR